MLAFKDNCLFRPSTESLFSLKKAEIFEEQMVRNLDITSGASIWRWGGRWEVASSALGLILNIA